MTAVAERKAGALRPLGLWWDYDRMARRYGTTFTDKVTSAEQWDAMTPREWARLFDGDETPDEAHRCEECGDSRFVRVTTNRDDPAFGKVKPCRCAIAQLPAEELLERSGLPKAMRGWTLATYPAMSPGKADGHAAVMRFVDSVVRGEQANLLLVGPPGSGKTGLAAAALHELAERGIRGRFAAVTELLWGIRARFNADGSYLELTNGDLAAADAPTYEALHIRMPVLVLDDLMKANGTAWVQENIFRWIDLRMHAGLSTVITLNESSAEVERAFGRAVVSRLQMFDRVVVAGDDLRAAPDQVRG